MAQLNCPRGLAHVPCLDDCGRNFPSEGACHRASRDLFGCWGLAGELTCGADGEPTVIIRDDVCEDEQAEVEHACGL
jgi:hypothetical protein